MKSLLLALAVVLCVTATARAEVYDGGNLSVRAAFPIRQAGRFEVANSVAEYSNITTYLAFITLHGLSAPVGSSLVTRMVADDITPLGAHPGTDVIGFTFSIANFNVHSVTFRPMARFWNANGVNGGPGTYYAGVGFDFAPVTVPALTVLLYTAAPSPGQFPMPGSTFWAGLAFDDNNGTTGATLADLDNLGQAGFNPPTVGSSVDKVFVTNYAGSYLGMNSPEGGFASYAQLGSTASLAWEFVVDETAPAQPTTWGRLKALYR